MTPYQWFTIIQTVATAFLAILIGIMFRGFQSGRWVQTRLDDIATLDGRVSGLEKRMNQAGEETSRLATEVQALPEMLRQVFVPRELFIEMTARTREERAEIRRDIERLWEVGRARKGGMS